MGPTSLSLLERLRNAAPDSSQWNRLHDIYLPLIRIWLTRVPGLRNEADDLAQEVLVILCRELPSFERRRDGAFRCWLRKITLNRIRGFRKSGKRRPLAGAGSAIDDLIAQLEDPASELSRQWERQHDTHVFRKLLATVKPDFERHTWEAFQRFVLDGQPAAQVAKQLGISPSAVVQSKARILKRLRQEAGGLLDPRLF